MSRRARSLRSSGHRTLLLDRLPQRPAISGPTSGARISGRSTLSSDSYPAVNPEVGSALPGHTRSIAPRSKIWPRRGFEGQVSGDESGPLFGPTRPLAVARERQVCRGLMQLQKRVKLVPTPHCSDVRIHRSAAAGAKFRRSNPYALIGRASGACTGKVVDHAKPRNRSGVGDPQCMQWQTKAAAKATRTRSPAT